MKTVLQSAFAVLALAAASAGPAAAGSAHGYLGVSVRDVTQDQLPALKLKDARGAEIILVDHDAPAGKAGLREHDVVLTINGQAVDNREQFSHMMRESPPGRTLVLVVSHDGQTRTVTTQMATQEEVERQAEQRLTVPEPMATEAAPQENNAAVASAPSAAPMRGNSFIGSILMSSSYTGAVLEKMSGQLGDYFGVPGGSGLLVRSVQDNSPAFLAGIHAGDVIVRAGDKPVATTSDWTKALKNSKNRSLAITVVRDKKQQTLSLNPESRKRSSVEFPDAPVTDESSAPAVAGLGLSLMPRS